MMIIIIAFSVRWVRWLAGRSFSIRRSIYRDVWLSVCQSAFVYIYALAGCAFMGLSLQDTIDPAEGLRGNISVMVVVFVMVVLFGNTTLKPKLLPEVTFLTFCTIFLKTKRKNSKETEIKSYNKPEHKVSYVYA